MTCLFEYLNLIQNIQTLGLIHKWTEMREKAKVDLGPLLDPDINQSEAQIYFRRQRN